MCRQSEGVIQLAKSYKTGKSYCIITEYCNGGDVAELLKARGGRLSEVECRLIMSKTVKGLQDLHSNGIVHRDLKLPNLMLKFQCPLQIGDQTVTEADLIEFSTKERDEFLSKVDLLTVNFDVRIADLGFSRVIPKDHDTKLTMCGTPLYMSPEIVSDKQYTFKTDIWSIGAMFFELLTGNLPFLSKSMKHLEKLMQVGTYSLVTQERPSIEALSFLSCCLVQDENKRASVEDLCELKFLEMSYQTHPLQDQNNQDSKKKKSMGSKQSILPQLKLTFNEKSSLFEVQMNCQNAKLFDQISDYLNALTTQTFLSLSDTTQVTSGKRFTPFKALGVENGKFEQGTGYTLFKDHQFSDIICQLQPSLERSHSTMQTTEASGGFTSSSLGGSPKQLVIEDYFSPTLSD